MNIYLKINFCYGEKFLRNVKISETREQTQNHCKYKNWEVLLLPALLGVVRIWDSRTKNLTDGMIMGRTKGGEREEWQWVGEACAYGEHRLSCPLPCTWGCGTTTAVQHWEERCPTANGSGGGQWGISEVLKPTRSGCLQLSGEWSDLFYSYVGYSCQKTQSASRKRNTWFIYLNSTGKQ